MENSTIQMITNVTSNVSDSLTRRTVARDEELIQLRERVLSAGAYIRYVIVAMGLIGNTLIMIVMSRKNSKNSSVAYFVGLAVSDMVVIIFGPMLYVIEKHYPMTSPRVLTFTTISLYTAEHVSSWMIVLLTAERAVCVAAPHRTKDLCFNKMKMAAIVITNLFILTYISIAFTVLLEASFYPTGALYYKQNYPGMTRVVMLADGCLKFFIPVFLLIMGSIFIIYKITVSGIRSGNNSSRRTSYVTLIFLASVLVFIVTMSPYYIITFMISALRYSVEKLRL